MSGYCLNGGLWLALVLDAVIQSRRWPRHTPLYNCSLTVIACTLQLVPCVNPLHHSWQSGEEVSADRSRLLLRLDMYALTEKSVTGDGNCQVGGAAGC